MRSAAHRIDKCVERLATLLQMPEPVLEQTLAVGGEAVGPALRAGFALFPLGGDDTVRLKTAQHAIQAARVGHDLACCQLLDRANEVVAVPLRPRKRCQHERLDERTLPSTATSAVGGLAATPTHVPAVLRVFDLGHITPLRDRQLTRCI